MKGAGPRISLPHWQQQFIRYSPHAGYWISYLDADKESMLFYYNLTSLSARLFTSEVIILPLTSVLFPFQLPFKNKKNLQFEVYRNSNDTWIKNKLMYNSGVNDRFLKALYLNRDHLLSIPDFIGVPTEHTLLFISHPIEWQYYVWNDGFRKKSKGSIVRFWELYNFFLRRMSSGFIRCRSLPLVREEMKVEALKEYLMILVKRGIIKEIRNEEYYVTGTHTK